MIIEKIVSIEQIFTNDYDKDIKIVKVEKFDYLEDLKIFIDTIVKKK